MLAVIVSGEDGMREEVWSKLAPEDAEAVGAVMTKGKGRKKRKRKLKKGHQNSTVN